MNQLKSIIHLCQRGYRGTNRNKSFGVRKNYKIQTEEKLYPDFEEFESENNENDNDPDELDADFSSVHKSYDTYQRETHRNKELLKTRIVARKYFKSNDPNFITWTEREQIKSLHSKDNKEWTPERLSESFPALPQTIKKILKSTHMPTTVQSVTKYDQNVIDNWKKFKAGNLPLDPELVAHLEKFKDRKIKLADLKIIANKLVKPKTELPVPQSTLFTNIIKGYIEQKSTIAEQPELQLNDGRLTRNTENKELVLSNRIDKVKLDRKYAIFDEYLERKINRISDNTNISLEDQLMMKEYQEKISQSAINNFNLADQQMMKESKENTSQSAIDNSKISISVKQETLPEPVNKVETTKSEVKQIPLKKIETIQSSLETGIVEWKKKSSNEEDDYPKFIKVPHSKAATGVTFKVNDRYYDCDGEFLYRVPGLDLNSSKT